MTSRVQSINVELTLAQLAEFLEMPRTGLKLVNESLRTFNNYPEGHSIDTLSHTLHGGDFRDHFDEEIHNYALVPQIIAKILMHNLCPKQGEFNRARGPVPILTYCIMCGIPVNIPSLIFEQIRMVSDATKNRGLPFGMLFTKLFKFWNIPVAGQPTEPPPMPIDYGFLSRKKSHTPTPAPPPPVPPVDPINPEGFVDPTADLPPPTFTAGSSSSSYNQFSDMFQDMTARFDSLSTHINTRFDSIDNRLDSISAYQVQLDINQSHYAAAARYQYDMNTRIYDNYQMDYPPTSAYSHPLPFDGPPFAPWVDPPPYQPPPEDDREEDM